MEFRCPACENDTVATVVPAGDFRYALCARCASYYLNPMHGANRLAREPERLAQFLQALQSAGPGIERQILRVLPRAGRIAASDLDLPGAPEDLTVRQARSLAERSSGLSVDALVLTSFIERVPIPDMAAEWCREKLNPGGTLVLSTPNANFARRVMAALETGRSGRAIAQEFGISPSMVSAIKHGRAWAALDPDLPTRLAEKPRQGKALEASQVAKIKRQLLRGVSSRKLAAEYGVSASTVLAISRGKTWAEIKASGAGETPSA